MWLMKNEKGYAMLIVLLLIVFITIVSAVFMRNSISNAKQEKVVDENQLSVVAAEMGVEYFKVFFNNLFFTEKDKLWDKYNSKFDIKKMEIEKNTKLGTIEKYNAIKELDKSLREDLYLEFKTIMTNAKMYIVDKNKLPQGAKFHYSSFDAKEKSEGDYMSLVISALSHGEIGKEERLFASISYEIPSFQKKEGVSNNVENSHPFIEWNKENIVLGDFPKNKCNPPVKNTKCLGTTWEDLDSADQAEIFYEQGIKKNNNGNKGTDFKDSSIISKSEVIFPNMNSVKSLNIITKENVLMKNVNSSTNLSVSAKGNMTVDHFYLKNDLEKNYILLGGNFVSLKSFNVQGLTMFTTGDLEIKGSNDNVDSKITNSIIYVNDNLEIGKSLVLTDSLLCVNANINLNKIIFKGKNKLVVTESAQGIHNKGIIDKINSGVIKLVSSNEIKQQCSFGEMTMKKGWESPILEVDYNKK